MAGVLLLMITDLCQGYFSYSQDEGLQIRTHENTAENKPFGYLCAKPHAFMPK